MQKKQDKCLLAGIIQAYDPATNYLNIEDACNLLCSRMYSIKFASHLNTYSPSQRSDLSFVLSHLKDEKKSKLADKTKQQLPSHERMITTFKNINWLLQYWMCKDPAPCEQQGKWDHGACFPDPLSQEYGFLLQPNGKVAWLDDGDQMTD